MYRNLALSGGLLIALLVGLSGCGEPNSDYRQPTLNSPNFGQPNPDQQNPENEDGDEDGDGDWWNENGNTNGDPSDSPLQQEPSNASNWASVAVGSQHRCGLKTNGSIWCWGSNMDGELGNGTTTVLETTPTQVMGSQEWAQVSAGSDYSCGVQTDGTLWCWGRNQSGQLGIGSTTDQNRPAQEASNLRGWTKVSTSATTFGAFTCGIEQSEDGYGLYCWGENIDGDYGADSFSPNSPHRISQGHWKDMEISQVHGCGIQQIHPGGGAFLLCWGGNEHGQLGSGTNTNSSTPSIEATESSDWEQVAVGSKHSCGLKENGTLWCWGDNSNGQLGTGDTSAQNQPVQESTGASNWTQVTLGEKHSCAIKVDGSLWCWGGNGSRELGDGTREDRHTPVRVGASQGPWAQVDASRGSLSHTCAVTTSNALYCWGSNAF